MDSQCEYYTRQKDKLLKGHKKMMELGRPLLTARLKELNKTQIGRTNKYHENFAEAASSSDSGHSLIRLIRDFRG
jgi:hypothetical protein